MDNIFYTYAYLREDRTPYYIGKGKGKRAWSKRKGVHPPKDKSRVLILKSNLSEQDAFMHEKYMIAVYGRKDLGTGILHNRTDGGEGSSGAVRSKEANEKAAEKMRGRKMPPRSKEYKENMSRLKKGNTVRRGATQTVEAKQKMSNSRKLPREEIKRRVSLIEQAGINLDEKGAIGKVSLLLGLTYPGATSFLNKHIKKTHDTTHNVPTS